MSHSLSLPEQENPQSLQIARVIIGFSLPETPEVIGVPPETNSTHKLEEVQTSPHADRFAENSPLESRKAAHGNSLPVQVAVHTDVYFSHLHRKHMS